MAKMHRPDGNKNWVGKRIAQLRKEKGLSQNALAVKLQAAGVDIGKNAIQQLEHGHRYIRDMELFVIAHALEVPIEKLFSGISFSEGGRILFTQREPPATAK